MKQGGDLYLGTLPEPGWQADSGPSKLKSGCVGLPGAQKQGWVCSRAGSVLRGHQLKIQRSELEWLWQQLTPGPWADHTATVSLSFLVCEKGMKFPCLPHRTVVKIKGRPL